MDIGMIVVQSITNARTHTHTPHQPNHPPTHPPARPPTCTHAHTHTHTYTHTHTHPACGGVLAAGQTHKHPLKEEEYTQLDTSCAVDIIFIISQWYDDGCTIIIKKKH